MNGIAAVIREAATSKKFLFAVAGAITAAALKIGLELSTEAVATVLSPIVAYIISQGFADSGKEAAKVQAVADASRGMTSTEEAINTIKNT